MKTKLFFIISFLFAGVIILGISAKQKQKISAITSQSEESSLQTSLLAPQTKTMGAVEVEVKPISTQPGEATVFELTLNTHSVELSYDYTQIATLADNQGNFYKPVKWTGESSGHHLSGELIFASLDENTQQLTLTLEKVDNETEDFTWKL